MPYLDCRAFRISSLQSPLLYLLAGPSKHPLRWSRMLLSGHLLSLATSRNCSVNSSILPSQLKVDALNCGSWSKHGSSPMLAAVGPLDVLLHPAGRYQPTCALWSCLIPDIGFPISNVGSTSRGCVPVATTESHCCHLCCEHTTVWVL